MKRRISLQALWTAVLTLAVPPQDSPGITEAKHPRSNEISVPAKDAGAWLEPPFQLSSAFDDAKVSFRGLVEHLEG